MSQEASTTNSSHNESRSAVCRAVLALDNEGRVFDFSLSLSICHSLSVSHPSLSPSKSHKNNNDCYYYFDWVNVSGHLNVQKVRHPSASAVYWTDCFI